MFRRFRRFVLFLVGVTVPIQAFGWGVGRFLTTPFKLAAAVLLAVAGVQYAMRSGGRWRDGKTVWLVFFLISFVMAMVMALVAGLYPPAVLSSGSTMISLVLLYFLLGYVIDNREDMLLLLWALPIGAVITVAPALGGVRRFVAEDQRFSGLAGQDNLLGADMNVCLAIAVGLFFLSRSPLRKIFLLGAGTLALGGIALSLSRSAFLSVAAMWGFWMYRSGSRGNLQYTVLALMVASLSLIFVPDVVISRFDTIFNAAERARDSSIQGRLLIDLWGVRAFLSNPLLGVGAPRFATWLHEQPGTSALPWPTIHNSYLGVAAEQGLLGLIPFLVIIGLSWKDYTVCWKAARAKRQLRDPALTELGHIALFLQLALVAGMVGGMFHQLHRSKTMWMVMALSPVVVGLARERLEALRATDSPRVSIFPEASEPRPPLPRPSPG